MLRLLSCTTDQFTAVAERAPYVECRRLGESPDPAPTERQSGIRITLGGGSCASRKLHYGCRWRRIDNQAAASFGNAPSTRDRAHCGPRTVQPDLLLVELQRGRMADVEVDVQ